MLPTPHRPSQQIQRDLNELKRKLQFQELPSLPVLEAAVQKATTQAVLDQTGAARADLQVAHMALRDGQEVWAQRAKDNTALRNLETELDLAQQAERSERIRQADSALNAAVSEYHHAALVCARALRKVLDQSAASARVPGASHNLSNLRVHQFNIPSLYGVSNQGTLGSAMLQGLQQFEQGTQQSVLKVA